MHKVKQGTQQFTGKLIFLVLAFTFGLGLLTLPVPAQLTLPFSGTDGSDSLASFSITKTGIGRSGLFIISNSSSTAEALFGQTNGLGSGVFGYATHASGTTTGVYGRSLSTTGRGVVGWASAGTGLTRGVLGWVDSTGGTGVYGVAAATSGLNYGVVGQSSSTAGRGILGYATAASGTTYGVMGWSNSTTGYGVYGRASSTSGMNFGVYGWSDSTNGTGTFGYAGAGSGTTTGAYGRSLSTGGRGVVGWASASSGNTIGVMGWSDSPTGFGGYFYGARNYFTGKVGIETENPTANLHVLGSAIFSWSGEDTFVLSATNTQTTGVNYGAQFENQSTGTLSAGAFGLSSAATGETYGLIGRSASSTGRGILGWANSTTGLTVGVSGLVNSNEGIAVRGVAISTSGNTTGILGQSASDTGKGVYGLANAVTGINYGVYGEAVSSNGFALWAQGDTGASGNKSFVIDHPLDPANKILKHFCSEGPEPLNVYSGNAVTDAQGYATIRLPDYFEAINRDFRYQLTVINEENSDDFVLAMVVREIRNNQFVLRTSKPGVKVSWEVKARRNDNWVRERGAEAEMEKPAELKGRYINPEFFGQPKEKGIGSKE